MLIHSSDWEFMKYSLYLSWLLLSTLSGRENPFFPIDDAKKQKVTSNVSDARPQMGTISYTFPDQARVLKEVSFTIQNLDGSIEERKVQIDQSIDWHRAITLSQGGASARSATNTSSAVNFGFIQLYSKEKTATIKTSDTLVRHFALTNPNRIVLDFNHNTPFNSLQKTLNAPPYQNVSVENHGKFARVSIALDGHYSYSVDKSGGLISITCK